MKYKDYYKILGIERNATSEEIRKAYRKLARKYHPDVSKETNAEERFKEINEANEVLQDSEKRAAYDQLGRYRPGQEFRPGQDWQQQFTHSSNNGFEDFDLSDLFANLFGQHTRTNSRSASKRGQDYETPIELTLEEAVKGEVRAFSLTVPEHTADGRVQRVRKTINVRIPKGVTDGQRMRVPGKGASGIKNGPPGDLYLNIKFKPHHLFKTDDHDLYLEVPISPWEAALGAALEIPILSGKVRLKIQPGTKSGQKFRLTQQGLPKPQGGNGDLYAIAQIITPPELNEKEKALFEELAQISSFNPRKDFANEPK